jgi:hypothetical protein
VSIDLSTGEIHMSERQAKRLRRAARDYILSSTIRQRSSASVQAQAYVDILREVWPRIVSHRARGRVSARLIDRPCKTSDLRGAVRLCVG